MSSNLNQLKQLLIEHGVAKEQELQGVGINEINDLESERSISFPDRYKDFLILFGRSAGYLARWTAFFFDDLGEMNDLFYEFLEEDGIDITLPQNVLFISNWESVFDYIVCDGIDEDPAVYRVDLKTENGVKKEKLSTHFTDYLKQLILNAEIEQLSSSFHVNNRGEIVDD